MSTDPSTLPQYDGRPVPWITRWSREVSPDRYKYGLQRTRDGAQLTYGPNDDRAMGVLWQREGITRGGKPDYAEVSTYRQRMAMRRGHCQVCGNALDERPIRWLMPLDGIEQVDEETVITMQAPTCSDCIPLALDLCPHLKTQGYMILKVIDYEPWGVYGHVVAEIGGQVRRFTSAVSFDTSMYGDTFTLDQVMAQQLVVSLGKFVIEEKYDPEEGS